MHVSPQLVAAHTYGAQGLVTGAGHAPWPLHVAGRVRYPAEQLGPRQRTEAPGKAAHLVVVMPSHTLCEQRSVGEFLGHGERDPWGAPVAGAQDPRESGRSHAAHWSTHAVVQQTPSTHKPSMQVLDSLQEPPIAILRTQFPLGSQYSVAAQSVSEPQAPKAGGASRRVGRASADAPRTIMIGRCAKPMRERDS